MRPASLVEIILFENKYIVLIACFYILDIAESFLNDFNVQVFFKW
jgi:hypothetical protein